MANFCRKNVGISRAETKLLRIFQRNKASILSFETIVKMGLPSGE